MSFKEGQLAMKKAEYEGKVFKTKNYGNVVVLEYKNSCNVLIKFVNTGNIRTAGTAELRKGEIRDNELKPVYKVGIMDVPNVCKRSGKVPKDYSVWNGIKQRCYNEYIKCELPSYDGCAMSEDFLFYSKFRAWYNNQVGSDQTDYHIDKDLLVKGNKLYSAETCCLLPPEINCALVTSGSRRGQHPLGVIYNSTKTRYRARIQRGNKWESLGAYDTPEEAFAAYKPAKEAHIKSLANKWKDKIDQKAFDALMNWTVEITD